MPILGGSSAPSPLWTSDGPGSPAAIHAPDSDMQINRYGYEPGKRRAARFEAGLRNIRSKNLGGGYRQGRGP